MGGKMKEGKKKKKRGTYVEADDGDKPVVERRLFVSIPRFGMTLRKGRREKNSQPHIHLR
jgi:hypothetical protein